MFPGPLFTAELLTTGRRARYYLVKVCYGLALLVVLWIAYTSSYYGSGALSIRETATVVGTFFTTFACVQVLLVLVLGPALAAGAIAGERERRTLEYLMATDLTNREIVFDKFAARLLLMAYMVLVGLPVLGIFSLMGGISSGDVAVLYSITASTMLVVVCLSLWVSAHAPRARDAVHRAYSLLFACLVLPPAFELLLRGPFIPAWANQWLRPALGQLTGLNPLAALAAARWNSWSSAANPGSPWSIVARMAVGHVALSLVAIAAATWAVRRSVQRAAGKAAPSRSPSGFWRRRPPVGEHAMLWKELFSRHSSLKLGVAGRIVNAVLLVTLVFAALWLFFTDRQGSSGSPMNSSYTVFCFSVGTGLACVIVILAAARSAGSVTGEKERDTWTTLVSTPLTAREIVWAKILGNLWASRWLAVVWGFVWILGALKQFQFLSAFVLLLFVLAGTLLILCLYASALGLMFSLSATNSLRSIAATLATGFLLGGGYLFVLIPLSLGIAEEFIPFLAPCIPILFSVPFVCYVELLEFGVMRDETGMFLIAYFMGTFGYAGAAFFLIESAIHRFDRLTRIGERALEKPPVGVS